MATLLYVSSNGSENPTKATVPFLSANGAVEAGHQPQVVLLGDAVVVMKDAVANAIVPVGWPPLKDVLATAIKNRTPVYV